MAPVVKRERGGGGARVEGGSVPVEEEEGQRAVERRVLRSRYLAVKNRINDDRDVICKVDSKKFSSIIGEVESLHQFVTKPREQVADAEALLDIANSLVTSVKSFSNEGLTPSDFITLLLENFGHQDVASSGQGQGSQVSWANVGLAVSHVFRSVPGCCTMLGPMNTELKQRKPSVPRKRKMAATASTCPEELEDNESEKRTDTDKNMLTMFQILRKHRSVRFENLVLNRESFAQTVENIFALSFLVKDGRVSMTLDDSGNHIISPKNAPPAAAVASGEVSFSHFVFRFDFKDWKYMMDATVPGEELMPHRTSSETRGSSQMPIYSQNPKPSTPIRKLTRNRGLVSQENAVGNGQSEDEQENHLRLKKI